MAGKGKKRDTDQEMDDLQLLDSLPIAGSGKEAVDSPAPVAEVVESSKGGGRRKRGRSSPGIHLKTPAKKNDEEDVCFICFDGGNLVICDRRGCPKAYHPACVSLDEAFLDAKTPWNCGWHICSICEKASQYMCYTCTYSLCKDCIKEAGFLCVRGNKGFCDTCMKTVMLIEERVQANKEMAEVDFNDKNSWEYLFKEYWLDLKGKLSLTLEELTRARNPVKGSGALARNEGCSYEPSDANDDRSPSLDSSSGHIRESESTGKMGKKWSRSFTGKGGLPSVEKVGDEGASVSGDMEWASKELLEFVAHMKDGDTSILSQSDVQALLLEYIKRNNLRDTSKKIEIRCDSRLKNLFGKARVGRYEMLKLLESHILIKEAPKIFSDKTAGGSMDADAIQMETEGNSDALAKTGSNKRRKSHKRFEGRGLQTNLNDFAAIDVHNINLIYLRRNLLEDLLVDTDKFQDKVVGSFVRIRISGTGQKQDIHRLVQVVGTEKAVESYKTGRTTDVTLEILNLDKTEVLSIDTISSQEFTEEECRHLRQSIKCGLINRLTVGEVQKKARALQKVKVKDWLETEISRLSNRRDQASEKGRRKELRECLEKLQLLSTPEERSRLLEEIPEVHADPNMDPSYVSDEDEGDPVNKKKDNNTRSNATQDIVPAAISTLTTVSSDNSETDNIWHYEDPSGKIQGPFSLSQLCKWSKTGYFPGSLRIWKTSEKQEDSILLTDAQNGMVQKEPPLWETQMSGETKQEGGWSGSSNSTWKDKQTNDGGWESNWNSAGGATNGNAELSKTDACGTQTSAWTSGASKVVSSKEGGIGSSSHAWDVSKSHSPGSAPLEKSDGWPSGQNVGNSWNSNRTTGFESGNQGFEEPNNPKGWETPSSSEAPKLTTDVWGAKQESGNNLSNLSTTPKQSSEGWPVGQSAGNKWSAASGQLTGSGSGTISNSGSDWAPQSPTIATDSEKIATGWGTEACTSEKPTVGGWENSNCSPASAPKSAVTINGGRNDLLNTPIQSPNPGSGGWAGGQGNENNTSFPGVMNDVKAAEPSVQQNMGWVTGTTTEGPDTRWGTTPESSNKGWGAAHVKSSITELETAPRGNTNWGATAHGNADAGWGAAPQGNTNAGWGKAAVKENTNADPGWGAAPQGNTDAGYGKAVVKENTNVNAGWGAGPQGNTNAGWGKAAVKENTKADAGWGVAPQVNTSAGWGKAALKENTNADAGWGAAPQGNTSAGWGKSAVKENTNADAGLGAAPQGNTSAGWGKSAVKENRNADAGWGAAPQGNTSGGWGKAAVKENANADAGLGAAPQGNTSVGWGKSAVKENRNADAGWGAAPQGNTSGGWGKAAVKENANADAGLGAAPQGNTSAGWGKSAVKENRNADAEWGAAPQGNSSGGWGKAAVKENTNAGWGAPQGNTNAGWGATAQGDTNVGWEASSGNSSTWGSQQKNTGERFSGHRDRGFHANDSAQGGEKPSWNRSTMSTGDGGPSRPPPRGQRVCKFHESGHCKKGDSCNFLHA